MKALPYFLLLLWPILGRAQTEAPKRLHEGAIEENRYLGPQHWYNENGRKVAEAVYDESGELLSYRTWTEDGELMDDERLLPDRKRKELPELDFVFDADGFGMVILPGMQSDHEPQPLSGDKVYIRYEGYLQDGTIFSSNLKAKKAFRFVHEAGEVIPGFDRAVSTLRVGDSGYFYVPWEMAYGEKASGDIPPYANLVFQILLEDLNSAGKRR
ncbi:MAG: FKBP-type peptidyl-prolyl cis-trans isomerase [Bacteroidota bacterium]